MAFGPFGFLSFAFDSCQSQDHQVSEAITEEKVPITTWTQVCTSSLVGPVECLSGFPIGLRGEYFNRDTSPRVVHSQLAAAMNEAAQAVRPFLQGNFRMVKNLQDAANNFGQVSCMQSVECGDQEVAVKQMPNTWVMTGPEEFEKMNPDCAEHPWRDVGFLLQLKKMGYPYSCDLLGIFRDEADTYVVTSLATKGDLFTWCNEEKRLGTAREALMRPIVLQLLRAVSVLHGLGVAHRDLSLENVLLTEESPGDLRVKVIDFGMSTLSRMCSGEKGGKLVYRAPEIYISHRYDAFAADAFALGVVLFATATKDYPWASTRPSGPQGAPCKSFRYVRDHGLRALLGQRKVKKSSGKTLHDVLSSELVELLEGLLEFDPARRMTLGEEDGAACTGSIPVVWRAKWVAEASAAQQEESAKGLN